MKKIYTLIAAAFVAFGANAQYDLSIAYTAYAGGETVTTTGIDLSFSVTNEGPATLTITDTIFVSYTRDGVAVYVTNVNITGVQYILLEEDLAPGASVGPFGPTDLGVPSGFSEEFCAVVYGVGAASVMTTNDDDYSNNTSCLSINVTDGYDVSIEDNQLELTNVYAAAGNLMIVSEGSSAGKLANMNIVNLNGQTVQTEAFVVSQGINTVALNNLAAGIYVVSIEIEGVLVTRKISIQ